MLKASTPMKNPKESILTRNDMTRRAVLAGSAAALALAAAPAQALNTSEAKALMDVMVGELNEIINSGQDEQELYGEFEKLFAKYADVPTIARSTLGPAARAADRAQMQEYINAFQGYMARKYGKRFREFIGGQVVVQRAEPWKSHFQVFAVVELRGSPPYTVVFRVSDRSGKSLFFDVLIEGISLLKSETVEIRALLDRNRGDIHGLTDDLNHMS